MKVKILKAQGWYKDKMNAEFEVVEYEKDKAYYRIKEQENTWEIKLIKKEDGVIIK